MATTDPNVNGRKSVQELKTYFESCFTPPVSPLNTAPNSPLANRSPSLVYNSAVQKQVSASRLSLATTSDHGNLVQSQDGVNEHPSESAIDADTDICNSLALTQPLLNDKIEKSAVSKANNSDDFNNMKLPVDMSLQALNKVLSGERVITRSNRSQAVWLAECKVAKLVKIRGSYLKSMGTPVNNTTYLMPEEVLFLVEKRTLELISRESDSETPDEDINILSVRDVFDMAISVSSAGDSLSLSRYRVYAHLKRLGFIVCRGSYGFKQLPALCTFHSRQPTKITDPTTFEAPLNENNSVSEKSSLSNSNSVNNAVQTPDNSTQSIFYDFIANILKQMANEWNINSLKIAPLHRLRPLHLTCFIPLLLLFLCTIYWVWMCRMIVASFRIARNGLKSVAQRALSPSLTTSNPTLPKAEIERIYQSLQIVLQYEPPRQIPSESILNTSNGFSDEVWDYDLWKPESPFKKAVAYDKYQYPPDFHLHVLSSHALMPTLGSIMQVKNDGGSISYFSMSSER